jgi:drug/metabolite transporter (DMT)-like permease
MTPTTAPAIALLSAALFGISPTLSKAILGEMSPVFLAGLLYLGSGIGLGVHQLFRSRQALQDLRRLTVAQRVKLVGAIVTGGVLAPICLAYGIQRGTAFEVALLLNFETVATTLLAWLFFHEYIGARVWFGKALVLAGAALVSLAPGPEGALSPSGLLVLGACFLWGLDNNLTRDIDELPPSLLAGVKGLAAGAFNVALAACLRHEAPVSGMQVAGTLGIGAVSYGLSLVLFVMALRQIGASRTSTYFAIGPFFGMLAAIAFLGERPATVQWLASVLMAAGAWALFRERHEHEHTHEALSHRHRHVHDEHHRHEHDGSEGPEPHDHLHAHAPLTHSHVHWPDMHHRHGH